MRTEDPLDAVMLHNGPINISVTFFGISIPLLYSARRGRSLSTLLSKSRVASVRPQSPYASVSPTRTWPALSP